MAPSFDYAASSLLLCTEENGSIFDDCALEEEFGATCQDENYRNHSQEHSFGYGGFVYGLPMQSDECLALMLERESQYLPASDYFERFRNGDLDLGARREAVDWIGKVHAHFNFGPLSAYLSVNYLDRFISEYEFPKGKAWMMQLLAVSCLSLAAKMEETEVPLSLDLQIGETKYVFEAKTIQRMELLVLSTLRWRMRAVTPFSFIEHFLRDISDDRIQPIILTPRFIELILSTIKAIDFLEYKPSEIAAAVAISVACETQTVDIERAISSVTQHVQKEKLLKCINLVRDFSMIGGPAPSVPRSPIGVLDAACLSYRSDETNGSCSNSTRSSPDAKRRKLNGLSTTETWK